MTGPQETSGGSEIAGHVIVSVWRIRGKRKRQFFRRFGLVVVVVVVVVAIVVAIVVVVVVESSFPLDNSDYHT